MRSYLEFCLVAMGGKKPYPYQERIALADRWSSVVEIPTGLGKTEAIVCAYLFRILERRLTEPRLLMYTLPMRSLVEQTMARINAIIDAIRASEWYAPSELPSVQGLLGGGDVKDQADRRDWVEHPEQRVIVVATQDMALSRALNRGYAVSRFKWPMAFGAISNDVLYVVDEMQLHGVGATTAAQLQGFRERYGVFGQHRTVFVSATVDPTRIDTVDHPLEAQIATHGILRLEEEDLRHPRVAQLLDAQKRVDALSVSDERGVAEGVLAAHRPGSLTLVIVNTVNRARAIHAAIAAKRSAQDTLLMHSRFRARERKCLAARLTSLDATPGADAIVVATQVVEAGVDISALTLVSDVAPWSSIVQRLGRCNRRGEQNDNARFVWIDDAALKAAPYTDDELGEARAMLTLLNGKSASPAALSAIAAPQRKPGNDAVIRTPEFLDLFDTTTDLSGNDVDVSRFIRDGDEFNVFVFWRTQPPSKIDPPRRDELCPVPRDDVHKLLDKLAKPADAQVVNPLARDRRNAKAEPRWHAARKPLRAGEIVWLSTAMGCYTPERGFDPSLFGKAAVEEVWPRPIAGVSDVADESVDDDGPTVVGAAVTLADHSEDARKAATALVADLQQRKLTGLSPELASAVVTAAYWHDVGKAHEVFQDTMQRTLAKNHKPTEGGPWAKSVGFGRHARAHFRHELASALSWLSVAKSETPFLDLIAYLIAAHHGKLRMAAYTLAGEEGPVRTILGIRDGELMPAVSIGDDIRIPAFALDLRNFFVGVDGTGPLEVWDDRVSRLRDADFGPFRLAYLELLVRLADWRASASEENLSVRNASIDDDDIVVDESAVHA